MAGILTYVCLFVLSAVFAGTFSPVAEAKVAAGDGSKENPFHVKTWNELDCDSGVNGNGKRGQYLKKSL